MTTSPIDLTLFHEKDEPAKNKNADKYNICIGSFSCFLLEWSGWYNYSPAERFMGHYRLYQIFKKRQVKMGRRISLPKAYILQYQSGHWLKYFIARAKSMLFKITSRGEPYPAVEIEAFNGMLVNRGSATLENFLTEADTDFNTALKKALAEVNQPGFPDRPQNTVSPLPVSITPSSSPASVNIHASISIQSPPPPPATVFVCVPPPPPVPIIYVPGPLPFIPRPPLRPIPPSLPAQADSIPVPTPPPAQASPTPTPPPPDTAPEPPPPRGKEKDILSKWQTLVLFDLLTQTAKLEKIDLHKPNRFDAIATLLRALTSRTKSTWLDELKDHQAKDLYRYDNRGQLDQLINSLINLTQFLKPAGFDALTKLAQNKIRELERKKANYKDDHKTT